MSEVKHALAALVEALEALGYPVVDAGGRIRFHPLALEFRVADVMFHPRRDTSLVQMLVEAAANGDAREGIRVNAVGFGPTQAEALRAAADQWVDGVLPVLHHWLSPHGHALGVISREMLVADRDSGRRFGWRAHLGPMLFTRYGDAEAAEKLPAQHEILVALFDELSPLSAHETVFWIEAFVGRVPSHLAQATCRLRGAEWPEGEHVLLEWAVAQPTLAGMGVRQFLLFEPVRPDALASRASLARTLDAELAKSKERA